MEMTIALTDSQYAALTEIARASEDSEMSAEAWASELLQCEVASRRLATVKSSGRVGAYGRERSEILEPIGHRVVRPEPVMA